MEPRFIKKIFDDYLKSNSKNALLINGEWGSGKTYFYKQELEPIIKLAEFKPYYISLNGLSTVAALEQALLVSLFVKTDNKEIRKTIKVGEKVLSTISSIFVNRSAESLLSDTVVNFVPFENKILCFDDLERCDIPLRQLLGYLNNLAEHRGAKILILSDESKIDSTDNNYSDIKEKLIGRVLNFEQDLSSILISLLTAYENNKKYKSFLLKYNGYILSQFHTTKLQNLRTIFFYLDIIEKLFTPLEELEDEIILKEVLEFVLLIAIDFKEGRLVSSDYHDYKGLNALSDVIFDLKAEDSEVDASKMYARSFCRRFSLSERYDFTFYTSLYRYILSGYLDKDEFNNELQDRKKLNATIEQQEFNELITYNFRRLSEERFTELLNRVKRSAENGVFSIYEYAQFADFYFYFSDHGLTSLTYKDINAVVDRGLNIAKQRKEINKDHFGNMIHFKKENSETELVKSKVVDLHNEILAKGQESINQRVNKSLIEGDTESLRALFEEYRHNSLLVSNIKVEDLFSCLLLTENKCLALLCNLIHERYCTISNIKDFLAKDNAFLIDLEGKIKDAIIDQKPTGVKQFNLNQLNKILIEAISILS
ncbi:P-loop NTPase fold protein [Sphingobacterium faecale]|uniref:KAP NTPase domain-containing protein n=1 Tax=Sphingobacterium faecale TaxID=2803775 RepID=A0ABS1RA06_9SPHI|nr:P-loop NTPase fold protein [Sphingobacterium faecale]MBL1411546.1 hypothetical protein [Sphingobacterium faecale]